MCAFLLSKLVQGYVSGLFSSTLGVGDMEKLDLTLASSQG